MTLTDEQRKRLTEEVLGECYHEGRMPINCGYRCVKCGDTYVVNRTFDNDSDMMALYRKLVNSRTWIDFQNWAWKLCGLSTATLFYEPERFCCLVAEWLEVKK